MYVVKRLIQQLGILLEDEHLEIAESIIWECIGLVEDQATKDSILEHFGML